MGSMPKYIICDAFGFNKYFIAFKYIKEYLDRGYKYDDIFILAPSCRNEKSPVRKLSNKLSSEKIPVYVPNNDDERLDENVLKNKIVFSTFHQAKGLERKIVIVYSIDDGYFKFGASNMPRTKCPNTIYVALTRAKEHLIVLHHYQNDYMPFVNNRTISTYADLISNKTISISKGKNRKLSIKIQDIVRHLATDTVQEALKYIIVSKQNNKTNKMDIEYITKQNDSFEDVSDILSVAIPSWFELKKNGKMTIFEDMITNKNSYFNEVNHISDDIGDLISPDTDENGYIILSEEKEKPIISKDYKKLKNINDITIEQLLCLSNEWKTSIHGYGHKVNQITSYDWFSSEKMNECSERLFKKIKGTTKFNIKIMIDGRPELFDKTLIGTIDCLEEIHEKINMWSFRVTEDTKHDNLLLVALQMYLYYEKIEPFYESDISEKEYLEMSILERKLYEMNEEKEFFDYELLHLTKRNTKNDKIIFNNGKTNENGIITKIVKYNEKGNIYVNNDKNEEYLIRRNDIIKNSTREEKLKETKNIYKKIINKINTYQNKIKKIKDKETREFYLFNIITDECYKLSSTRKNLREMVNYLFTEKFSDREKLNDKDFIIEVNKMKKLFIKST
jgi:hypothetical protein